MKIEGVVTAMISEYPFKVVTAMISEYPFKVVLFEEIATKLFQFDSNSLHNWWIYKKNP